MTVCPPIPLLTPIQGGLCPGMVILIAGIVLPNAKRFEINLQTGGGQYLKEDIALHFNPHFPGPIVRDTLLNCRWQHQQSVGHNPLSCSDTYVIQMVVGLHGYKISINGVYFCDYSHIISFEKVTHLGIMGDTSITMIGFEWPSLVIPYIIEIPGHLQSGMELEVAGHIKANAQRYNIDLQCGQDIALHFKQCFPSTGIVLNHYQCQNWGFEDIYYEGLSQAGQPLKVQILSEDSGYQIFINNCYFTFFSHRLPWQVAHLAVRGDVRLTRVSFSWNVQKKFTASYPSQRHLSSEASVELERSNTGNRTLKLIRVYNKSFRADNMQHTTSPPQLETRAP